MKKAVLLKLAGSALVIGGVVVGCTPAGHHPAAVSSAVPKAEKAAADAAADATEALKNRKAGKAIREAEKAVALAPQDAGYRTLLGQAYLQGGRFASAETSFADALSLSPEDGKAALSMALAQISLGKTEQARATLAAARGRVPDADVGLGFALAGDREQSLILLENAARAEGADAKTRQNLALAYALAGRWREARIVVGQDLPPNEVPDRIQKWAAFVQPRGPADQVAALLGVTPAAVDPGQPTQLALRSAPQAQPVATAAAEPELLPTEAEAQAADYAEAEAPAEVPAYVAPEAPVQAPMLLAQPEPARSPMVQPAASHGRYVVQLGAFSSARRAEIAWSRSVGRVERLSAFAPSSTTIRHNAALYHRLSVGGFATRAEALKVCGQIKARGGDCFVRSKAGDVPVQWASLRNNYASR